MNDLQRGACVGHERPELWDIGAPTTSPEDTRIRDAKIAEAKTICATCTVRDACLDYGLSQPHEPGLWLIYGGQTPEEYAPERRSAGRPGTGPRIQVDADTLEQLARQGLSLTGIAKELGVNRESLRYRTRRHYPDIHALIVANSSQGRVWTGLQGRAS